LLSATIADRLRTPCRLSARCQPARYSLSSSCVLVRSSFDPFDRVLLVTHGLADSPRVEVGQSVRRGRTVIEGAVLEVPGLVSDDLPQPRRQFAQATWTVRPVLADGPPSACGRSAWCSAELLSPLLLEFLFLFGIVWGLLLGLVGPL
jgi:hypothetical protein